MPTKPMMPRKDTHTAVITEASSMETKRSLSTATPMLLAAASPLKRALNCQLISVKNNSPASTVTAMMQSVR